MITESFIFHDHLISNIPPFKFTLINLFFSNTQFKIQATTELQAHVQQASVSAAPLSHTLIFICLFETISINSTLVLFWKFSVLFSIGFQYFSTSKFANFQLSKNITACGFHILTVFISKLLSLDFIFKSFISLGFHISTVTLFQSISKFSIQTHVSTSIFFFLLNS